MATPLTVNKSGEWRKVSKKNDQAYTLLAQYSPTGRAKCRRCGDVCEKGKLRVGVPTKDQRGENGYISCWQHVACTRVDDVDTFVCERDIFGFEDLEEEDRSQLRHEVSSRGAPTHVAVLDTDEVVKRGPMIPRVPPPTMLRQLLPYQLEGLGWLVAQEEAEGECRGGLLADEMGMGKTIQMISLILERKGHGPTLVICPLSSMMQWQEEITAHTAPGALRVLVFHGTTRNSVEEIMRADVVLTTYSAVQSMWSKLTATHKTVCEYCSKSFLPRKMAVHLKYFCGPEAVKTAKQNKQEKKRQRKSVISKGLKALKVTKDGESESDDEEVAHPATAKHRKLATPMTLYTELMHSAGRHSEVIGRFERKDDIKEDIDASSSADDGDSGSDAIELASAPSEDNIPTVVKAMWNVDIDEDAPLCGQILASMCGPILQARSVCPDCDLAFKKFEFCPQTGVPHPKAVKQPLAPLPEDELDLEGFEDVDLDFRRSTLHSVQWFRIILDEAHKIKTKTTSTARGVYALRATHKWCVTGTPLQNRVGELFSLIRFLRLPKFSRYYCGVKDCECTTLTYPFTYKQHSKCVRCGHGPLQHFSYFNKHILNPIKRYGYVGDGRRAMVVLKEQVLDRVMLRRTKAERAADLRLPPMHVAVHHVDITAEERDFYEGLYKRSTTKFDAFVDKGTLLNNYAHIFALLSSLRQALDHPYIVLYRDGSAENTTAVPYRAALDLCAMCQDGVGPSDVVVTRPCLHTFHRSCMAEYVQQAPEGQAVGCPKCFTPLTIDVRALAPPDDDAERDEDIVAIPPPGASPETETEEASAKPMGRRSLMQRVDLDKFHTSSKLEAIVTYIQSTPAGDKSIVFSQYGNMLDIVEWRLERAGIRAAKLTGAMPLVMRQSILHAYRAPESLIRVLLISLKAGGEGLNLQVANHVVLIDPWWNPAVEMQAIQRCHRLGQTKEVRAIRLISRDTIEERMLELQDKKMLVFEGTIDSQRASMAKLSEDDLKFLFNR